MPTVSAPAAAGSDDPTYAYKPNLVGSPWMFTLRPGGLEWQIGRRSGILRYDRISHVRLSFRPATLQTHRFIAEIWSADCPKIQIASASWRSMMDQERLDAAYATFIAELHRRIAPNNATVRLSAGMPVALFGVGAVVFVGTMLAIALLVVRAMQAGEWSGAALVGGFFLLFGWQVGDYLRRNWPGSYRPEALPAGVLPRIRN